MNTFLHLFCSATFSLFAVCTPHAFGGTTIATFQGGTGTTSPSGILYGDDSATTHLNTATIGSGLSFSGGTLSASGGAGTPAGSDRQLQFNDSGSFGADWSLTYKNPDGFNPDRRGFFLGDPATTSISLEIQDGTGVGNFADLFGQNVDGSAYFDLAAAENSSDLDILDNNGEIYLPLEQDMYINSTHNLGIGTTTPVGKLHIDNAPLGDGSIATTTFTIGEIGTTTSVSCFNAKNTAGSSISFYFVGTTMKVESQVCK